MRFPQLAHRSAAAHKLHSTRQQHAMNLISGKGETSSRLPAFSLFLPGTCPNNRDPRRERFTPVKVTFGRDLYRVGYDSAKLSKIPVSDVRDALHNVLGERAFDRLLRATDDEYRAMAAEAIETESGGCAAEFASEDLRMFRIRTSRALPQPLLYAVLRIVRETYLAEFTEGILLFLEDLAKEDTEWTASGRHFAGSLESIREIGPVAGGATPAQIREWMRAAIGTFGLARLNQLSAAEQDDLKSHVAGSLRYSGSKARGLRPLPPPEISRLALFTAEWALETVSIDDISKFLSIVLLEVGKGGEDWTSEVITVNPAYLWFVREYSEQLRSCTPRDIHDWLSRRLGADRARKLFELSDDERSSLARQLLSAKQDELDPPSWGTASSPANLAEPAVPSFVNLAANWVSRLPARSK
jgi:hypothetical protein